MRVPELIGAEFEAGTLESLPRAVLTALLVAAAAPTAAGAEPFSFVATQTDQLGVPGLAASGELTPEGNIYTGYAELGWRFGAGLKGWDQPTRTAAAGRYPVYSSVRSAGGVRYTLSVLAAEEAGHPFAFARVTMTNAGDRGATARWGAALSWSGGGRKAGADGLYRFRFLRPASPPRDGLYSQVGEAFARGVRYSFGAGGSVMREGSVLALYPPGASRRTSKVASPSAVGAAGTWHRRLRPGASARLDFAVPLQPLQPADMPSNLGYDSHRATALRGWRAFAARAARIDIPEREVEDAWYASLVNMAVPRYKTADGYWVQAVNKLQYNAFWLRDAAVIANAFDLAGLHDLASEDLGFFPTWQQPDGLYISRPEQFDGFGQALWGYGEHVRLTQDAAFARKVLPSVTRAMDWLARTRAADPLHLLPAGTRSDNELVSGHVTGDDLWAVAGASAAVGIARAAGDATAADRFTVARDDLKASLLAQLAPGRRIPPALDAPGGQDWGNLWASYPTGVFDARDSAVTATLKAARKRFNQGIATYRDGRHLHGYIGFRIFQTELMRGEQDEALRGLYDSLAHTTATYGGFETGIRVRGSRSVDDNMTPHGWWAAEYVALVRNMLVREDGEGLVLGSAIPARWLRPGRTVAISSAPTAFGPVSFRLRATRAGAKLRWSTPIGVPVQFRIPAAVGGVRGSSVSLPGGSGTKTLRWTPPRGDGYDYAAAVARVKRRYHLR